MGHGLAWQVQFDSNKLETLWLENHHFYDLYDTNACLMLMTLRFIARM